MNAAAPVPVVLIAEPDVLVRHPLAEYLRECGFKVLEAQNLADARAFLAETTGIDVVIADTALPDGGGFTLAQEIRKSHPGIQVILAGTPAKLSREAGELCEKDGPALTKPYDHQKVLDRIKQLLAARDRAKKE